MINIGVSMREEPSALIWISRKIVQHILVNLFLQINPDCPVCANDFIGANAGIGRNVPVWVRNADVSRVISDGMVRAFNGGVDEFLEKLLMC